MFAVRIFKGFAKIKPLKISAVTTEKGVKVSSGTESHSFEIHNAFEGVMGSLAACQNAAIGALTKEGKFKVSKINFKKMESQYNLERFMAGGKENKIDDIVLEAEFETNGTQADLDALKEKVHKHCPVYNLITSAGVNIKSTWRNVYKQSKQSDDKSNKSTEKSEKKDNHNEKSKSEKPKEGKEHSESNNKKDTNNGTKDKNEKQKNDKTK